MSLTRSLTAVAVGCSFLAVAGCATAPPPPPAVPASFIPLGVSAPYLSADVISGYRARAAKMRAAKIRPLVAAAVPFYMGDLQTELRRQTAGIGLDVLRVGNNIVIRIPAALTFDPGSAAVKPQTDATLLEIARTVKTRNQTFVDVIAHTDTSGTPQVNQALSDKRASAVAGYLANHGVAKARIASRGYGESAPLYAVDDTEMKKAANRRVEIRLVPYYATAFR
jgi:outer membrane protein OmpA-like peptidoglycan-associated protein